MLHVACERAMVSNLAVADERANKVVADYEEGRRGLCGQPI